MGPDMDKGELVSLLTQALREHTGGEPTAINIHFHGPIIIGDAASVTAAVKQALNDASYIPFRGVKIP